jgi:hypothetical protein
MAYGGRDRNDSGSAFGEDLRERRVPVGPGEQFIIHPAYGRIGGQDVGGLEVIGYDPATGDFRTHFFDHAGNVITETLTFRDDTWTWQATHHRCKGVFTDNGKILTAHHEQSDDGKQWRPLMIVTLPKVE